MNRNGIPSRPYLKPWYRIAREQERLILEYGQAVVVFEGRAVQRLLPALLPLLDGSRSIDEISAVLGEPIRPAIEHALGLLADKGLLTQGPALEDDSPAPFLQTTHFLAATAFDAPPISAVWGALEGASVGVLGAGATAAEITRLLRLAGVGRVERLSGEDDDGHVETLDLAVVAPAGEDLPAVAAWNRQALRAGATWLQVLPFDGKFAAIGPVYLPGETCCYECYRLRRLANVAYKDEFPALEDNPAAYPDAPSLRAVIAGVATTLALRWIGRRDRVLPGTLLALEHGTTLALTLHRVYRVPRCPECSGLEGMSAPLPWFKEIRVSGC